MTTCPRRMMDVGPWERKEDLDEFRADRTCSFCGSLSPDAFMDAVRKGTPLAATDKNYKVYIQIPGRPFTKFYFQHLSETQQREFVELYNDHTAQIENGNFYVFPFFMRSVINGS